MSLRIRPDSPVPIYEQIRDQVVYMIAMGDLSPGSMVPSVRDQSVALVVNPNTVVRAYQELERMGLIDPKRGVGMIITEDAPKLSRDHRRQVIETRIEELIREAQSAGLELESVQELLAKFWKPTLRNGQPKSTRS